MTVCAEWDRQNSNDARLLCEMKGLSIKTRSRMRLVTCKCVYGTKNQAAVTYVQGRVLTDLWSYLRIFLGLGTRYVPVMQAWMGWEDWSQHAYRSKVLDVCGSNQDHVSSHWAYSW